MCSSDLLPQKGSLMFRISTIYNVMYDLARTLSKQGFIDIWISSFHGGPRHFIAMEKACHKANKKFGSRMISVFSLLINKLTEGTPDLSNVLGHIDGINPGDLKGDTHAGLVETSMMLRLMGEHVKQGYRELPQQTVDLKLVYEGREPMPGRAGRPSIPSAMKGFKAALEYFAVETYSGKPDGSTEQIGEEILDTLSGLCAETLNDVLNGKISPDDCHSPIWPMRWVFSSQWIGSLFERSEERRVGKECRSRWSPYH